MKPGNNTRVRSSPLKPPFVSVVLWFGSGSVGAGRGNGNQSKERWRHKHNTRTAIVSGCQVNLKDSKTGRKLGKEWRMEVTHRELGEKLHCVCKCQPHELPHATCEGSLTRASAYYTPEFARRAVFHMSRLVDVQEVYRLVQENPQVQDNPRCEQGCECKQVQRWNKELSCFDCMCDQHGNIFAAEQGGSMEAMSDEHRIAQLDPQERDKILRQLSLVHSSTGHGSYHLLVQALKRQQARPEVLALARTFRCSACEERKRPDPRSRANLKVFTDRWKSIQVDAAFWRNPRDNKQSQFVVLLDEASRFMVTALIPGHKRGISPQEYIEIFEQKWKPYFGVPDVVRSDPEGAWRSQVIQDYFTGQGTMLDIIPAKAHWNLSNVERSIQWVKELLSKLAQDTDMDVSNLLSHATYIWNQHENVRGYSPFQHALGRHPDSEGRFFENMLHDVPMEMIQHPDGEMEQAAHLRTLAAKQFLDWQLKDKLGRARNSRHHSFKDLCPGDLVFYWRTQILGNEKQSWNRGRYVGPARVLALETRNDEDGRLSPSSVAWLVKGNRIVKVAIEQIRHASAREQNLHELTRPPQLPRTFTELLGDVKRGVYHDHVEDGPKPYKRAAIEPEEGDHPTGRRRYESKQPPARQDFRGRAQGNRPEIPDTQDYSPSLPPEPREPSPRSRSRSPRGSMPQSSSWQEEVHSSFWARTESSFWQHSQSCVEIDIELPRHDRGWKKLFKNSQSFFISALKRKSIEVSERRLSQEEHEQFQGAKQVEVDKFIASEALQALPPHLRPNKEQALRMRWILVWKKKEDGSVKPKARAVVLGYQDPDYANRPTFAPTMTRQTRQVLLQWAANHQAEVKKGDVAAAFLQGREFARDLYLIPTPEICTAMNIAPESVVKMRKACYGLVEARIEWFETMNTFLQSQGLEQLKSDPCCWRLRDPTTGQTVGLVLGHVDDFLFSGLPQNKQWEAAERSIRERFNWGEWEVNDFVQCGVRVRAQKDHSFWLDQEKYVQDIQEINIPKNRRETPKESTTDAEKTELRGLLGALAWHTSQVGFRFSSYTSLYLSEVNSSTVETLIEVNMLLRKIRNVSHEPMKIFPFEEHENPQLYCWTDASNQNRHDGSSTKGVLVGMSGGKLESGEIDRVSPWFWQSGKIDRVCRSPGSSEARAFIDGEDILHMLRFQWGEIIGHEVDIHDIDNHVSRVGGVLITDSRNVYDRVEKPYITPKGAQRRVDLELLTIKEAQARTKLRIRWVSSQAMLANSLTKKGEDVQLGRFVQMGQVWRIVDDQNMFSGRKRIAMGKSVLE